MSSPRSLTWRILPWLVPVALILIGLVFVTTSLTGTAEPSGIVAPPNVRDVTNYNASGWANSQVPSGVTSEVSDVVMVDSEATGATTFAIRAVIVRVDSTDGSTPDTEPVDQQTVATCVSWDVDVSTGAIVEHGASEISRVPGNVADGDTDSWRDQCEAAVFA